jgi:hypothetical protein
MASTDWPRAGPAKDRETSGNNGVLKRRNRLLTDPFQRVFAGRQSGLHRIPKPRAEVRFLPGAQLKPQFRTSSGSEEGRSGRPWPRIGPAADTESSSRSSILLSLSSRPKPPCRPHDGPDRDGEPRGRAGAGQIPARTDRFLPRRDPHSTSEVRQVKRPAEGRGEDQGVGVPRPWDRCPTDGSSGRRVRRTDPRGLITCGDE